MSCPICLDPAGTNGGAIASPDCSCNILCCTVCLDLWLLQNATCPTCRAPQPSRCSNCDGFVRVCRALITISRSDGNNTCIIDCSRFGLDPAALANPAWVRAAAAALEQDGYEVDIRRPNGGQHQKLVVAW